MRQGATAGLPKKQDRASIYGGRIVWTQFVQRLQHSNLVQAVTFWNPPGVFMMSIVNKAFFMTGCPSWRQPHMWDALPNHSKHCMLAGTQLIQLYKFVCTIPTQNINFKIHSKNSPLVASYDIHMQRQMMLFYSDITRFNRQLPCHHMHTCTCTPRC